MTDDRNSEAMNDLLQRLRGNYGKSVFDMPAICDEAADEIERLRGCLRYEQHRFATLNTHSDGCYAAGPMHYDCAMAEIERLTLDWVRKQGERTAAENELDRALWEIERLRAEVASLRGRIEGYRDACKRLPMVAHWLKAIWESPAITTPKQVREIRQRALQIAKAPQANEKDNAG